MRVVDFFGKHPLSSLTGGNQPELMRSLLQPKLENLEDGLLIYRERKIVLARLLESETNDSGYGGQAEFLGDLDGSNPQSSWPETWHFRDSWEHCHLSGSWVCASPYVGFHIIVDPDLVRLAKKCCATGNNEPFELVLYLLEQEEKQLNEQYRNSADSNQRGKEDDQRIDIMILGEMMKAYLEVLRFSESHFALKLDGIHGIRYWFRVIYYGLKIASQSRDNLDRLIIILFALLHDVERRDDGIDPEHGTRAAKLIPTLQGKLFNLNRERLQLLVEACEGHTGSERHPDPTVRSCWDADRLDLTRIGTKIDPNQLLTIIGKKLALEMGE